MNENKKDTLFKDEIVKNLKPSRKNKFVISHKNDLVELSSYPVFAKKSGTKIICKLPYLTKSENKYWQKKLNRYAFSCGCVEGAILGLAGVILIAVKIQTANINFSSLSEVFSSSEVYFSLVLFAFFIVSGKLSGIWYSRWRFKKIIYSLLDIHKNQLENGLLTDSV